MNFKLLDSIYDTRMNCFSIMLSIPVPDYLDFVKQTYNNRGGIKNQRGPLKTASAKTIRERMVKDIEAGAVLPPVVIGLLIEDTFSPEHDFKDEDIQKILTTISKERVSIIDGMQRTTALFDAEKYLSEKFIRIDLWLSSKIQALTYRMLVLNTGQIPWDLRRQVEVVYEPLIAEIGNIIDKKHSDITDYFSIIKKDDNERRKMSGDYHASDIVEIYLAFSLKTEKVAMKSVLAEEFSRLDMMQAMLNVEFVQIFVTVFSQLARIDIALGNFNDMGDGSLKDGKDLFKSLPAKVGFITAASQKIFGIAGRDLALERQYKSIDQINKKTADLVAYLLNPENKSGMKDFLSFDILLQRLEDLPKGSKIGDKQRELFLSAFKVLFSDDFDLDEPTPSFSPLWRAN